MIYFNGITFNLYISLIPGNRENNILTPVCLNCKIENNTWSVIIIINIEVQFEIFNYPMFYGEEIEK